MFFIFFKRKLHLRNKTKEIYEILMAKNLEIKLKNYNLLYIFYRKPRFSIYFPLFFFSVFLLFFITNLRNDLKNTNKIDKMFLRTDNYNIFIFLFIDIIIYYLFFNIIFYKIFSLFFFYIFSVIFIVF